MTPKTVAILGSTGSIGCSTIDLIMRDPQSFQIEALTAQRDWAGLARQAIATRAKFVAIGEDAAYLPLKEALFGHDIEIAAGRAGIVEAATRPADWVMAAIVGAAGLAPTLAAIRRGAVVALANKETLVCAGSLVQEEVARWNATLLPVDSEHNAIFQVFDFDRVEGVEKLILTASGGPFRSWARADMAAVTPAQAVKHPNWSMGAKISVDSATMMNKGLELIEAHYLFGVAPERLEVLVHPQSVIHSMVAYVDGSVLAQLGPPDMRTPIAYTLAWPARMTTPTARLDLAALRELSFEPPDEVRFPALKLARLAMQAGGAAPTVLNAANEIAVQAFLEGRIGFLDIADTVEATLDAASVGTIGTLDDVHNFDKQAREIAVRLTGACSDARNTARR